MEPLPGYRLIEPLGSGGFGEVWKCEVPGGLFKAIKFVSGNLDGLDGEGAPAEQELEALQSIKAIRHPFILSMDRIEVIKGELIIVMELADRSLHEVLGEWKASGMPGIPREELLALLLEGAEALDLMNFKHGLQHLDIKPRNLFVVSNHLKVADFGLVKSLGKENPSLPTARRGGISPLYASPEILQGSISRHSDQYSLAVVYQELLTGTLPFQGKNGRQLLLNSLTTEPRLEALPPADRPLVARALSKDPEKRYPSCLDFLQALVCADDPVSPKETTPAATPGRKRPQAQPRNWADLPLPQDNASDSQGGLEMGSSESTWGNPWLATGDTLDDGNYLPVTEEEINFTGGASGEAVTEAGPSATPSQPDRTDSDLPTIVPCTDRPILKANPITSNGSPMAISALSAVATLVTGRDSFTSLFGEGASTKGPMPSRDRLVQELISAGANASKVRTCDNFRFLHHSGNILEYKCLVRLGPERVQLKLDEYCRQWKAQVVRQDSAFVFRIKEAGNFLQRCVGRQTGLEVQAELRPLQRTDAQLSVATIRIQSFGGGDEISQRLWEMGPVLFQSLRSYLQPDPEHRIQQRFPYPYPVRIFPVSAGRQLGEVIDGKGKDISRGGLGFVVPQLLPTEQVYLQLCTTPQLAAYALLAGVVRSHPVQAGFEIGVCFPP